MQVSVSKFTLETDFLSRPGPTHEHYCILGDPYPANFDS